MIIQELRAEFNEYFQSLDPELILWLDHSVQWKEVINHLKRDFRRADRVRSKMLDFC